MVGLSTIICNVAWVTRSGRPKDEVKEASPSVWPSPLSDVQKTSVLLGDGFPYRVRRQIKCQRYQFNLLLTKYLHCSHFPNLCIVAKISIFSKDVWQLALIVPRCIHSSSNLPPSLPPSSFHHIWRCQIDERGRCYVWNEYHSLTCQSCHLICSQSVVKTLSYSTLLPLILEKSWQNV